MKQCVVAGELANANFCAVKVLIKRCQLIVVVLRFPCTPRLPNVVVDVRYSMARRDGIDGDRNHRRAVRCYVVFVQR